MKLIAQTSTWRLCDRQVSRDGWTNFRLVSTTGGLPKRSWWLGWNGGRLARNRDAGLLEQHHPEIHAWVIHVLSAANATILRQARDE